MTRRRRPLILTHRRPDGDAAGGAAALTSMLRSAGIAAKLYVEQPLPARYAPFVPETLHADTPVAIDDVDALICLDCARPDMLFLPPDWDLRQLRLPTCSIDHHVDSQALGEQLLVLPRFASTCEILAVLFREADMPLTATAATALLIGVIMDTGGFRFSNTDAKCLATGSWLLAQGADHQQAVQALFFNEPLSRVRLQARLVDGLQFAFDGRLAYTLLTPRIAADCGADDSDTEGMIDAIRGIAGVEVACLMQLRESGVRFSFRSQAANRPVIRAAQALGGGGHRNAAGATVEGIDATQAERLLLQHVREVMRD